MNMKSVIASSLMILLGATVASADMFADVPASHWAYNAIRSLSEKGIVEGFPNNSYKGDRNVTRYELALITAKMLAKTEKGGIASSDLATLEKLTIEFADELSLMGVKTTALEDGMQTIKDDVSGIKKDMDEIKSYYGQDYSKVKLSGDMLVRHISTDEKNLSRKVRTHSQLRLRLDAQVAENVKAVARWRMIDDNHENAQAGMMGAAWNGANHATAKVDTAYLMINDMFGFGGDFVFGRRRMSHGHALVMNNYYDAVSYNKTSGDVELAFNLFFDRQGNDDDTHNVWNITADTKFRGHDLYLGVYYVTYTKEAVSAIVPREYRNDSLAFDATDSNSKVYEVEFGGNGDLGNNGYWSYDLGGVYQVNKEFVKKADGSLDDANGFLLHGAINWDSKEQWALKAAYSMVDDEAYMYNTRFDERYCDNLENPFEDVMRGYNFDNGYGFGNKNPFVNNIQDTKIQVEYRPSKRSKHYFRVAYDFVRAKDDDKVSTYFAKKTPGANPSDKADVVNLEYRYRIAENTRIRIGYTDFKYSDGDDTNLVGAPNNHHRDYGMFWTEIFSRF